MQKDLRWDDPGELRRRSHAKGKEVSLHMDAGKTTWAEIQGAVQKDETCIKAVDGRAQNCLQPDRVN